MGTTLLTKTVLVPSDCEYADTLPHKATHQLTWFLNSGILVKFSCKEHMCRFGAPGYLIAEIVGWEDNYGRPLHPLGSREEDEE